MKVSKMLFRNHPATVDLLTLSPDRDKGDHLKLADIQKLVEEDAEMQNLSKSQKKVFIDGLKELRETMKSGVCASNLAAVADCRAIVDRISTEVSFSFMFLDVTQVLSAQRLIRTHWDVFAGFLHPHSHSR